MSTRPSAAHTTGTKSPYLTKADLNGVRKHLKGDSTSWDSRKDLDGLAESILPALSIFDRKHPKHFKRAMRLAFAATGSSRGVEA